MSDPLVFVDDLALYLNDPRINEDRAQAMIDDTVTLCESYCNPLPPAGAVIVKRVAARAYVAVVSSRQDQMQAGGSMYGGQLAASGGPWLSDTDKADLRRLNGGGGAFSINLLPPDYGAVIQPWDVDWTTESTTGTTTP